MNLPFRVLPKNEFDNKFDRIVDNRGFVIARIYPLNPHDYPEGELAVAKFIAQSCNKNQGK